MKVRLPFALAALLLAVLPVHAETTDQWIAKARSFLGGENALKAVKSIHFVGKLEAADGQSFPIEIIFQKPFQQRISVTGSKVIETTALDGYDAWQRRANPENPAQWQVVLLDASQVKRLRANTLENLSFYWNQTKEERRVELVGETSVDGVDCVKISFVHSADISFMRYFEKSTGRLVKTETENNSVISEEGVTIVSGIRFPRKVVNVAPNGRSTTISFDKITVNESFPADTFVVPSMQYK